MINLHDDPTNEFFNSGFHFVSLCINFARVVIREIILAGSDTITALAIIPAKKTINCYDLDR